MASAVQLIDPTPTEPTPTPIFELPIPEPPTHGNRRFLPRVRHAFHVTIDGEARSYEGLDLSFGGLMCRGEELVWPGNEIALTLHLPGLEAPLAMRGRVLDLVAHRGGIAMRIRFVGDADGHGRRRIAQWMARRAGHRGASV